MPAKKYTKNFISRTVDEKHQAASGAASSLGSNAPGSGLSSSSTYIVNSTQASSNMHGANGVMGDLSPPKHNHLPQIPLDSDMVYFIIITLIAFSATAMQYLHLYRTAWWLPHSHARYAVNFYLIDMHLVGFLATVEVIPLMLFFFRKLFIINHHRLRFILAVLSFLTLTTGWILSLIFFSIHIYRHAPGVYLPALAYPLLTYVFLYHGHGVLMYLWRFFKRSLCTLYKIYYFIQRLMGKSVSSTGFQSPPSNSDHYNGNQSFSSTAYHQVSQLHANSGTSSPVHSPPPSSPSIKCSTTTATVNATTATTNGEQVVQTNGNSTTEAPTEATINGPATKSTGLWRALPDSSHTHSLYSSATPVAAVTYNSSLSYASKRVKNTAAYSDVDHRISAHLPFQHNCTNNPEKVREEAEALKADFNYRSRDILFSTFFVCFYSTLVPLLFVSNTIHYDGLWCAQHVFLTALCIFLTAAVHYLPPAYIDLMHRCALHLGQWSKEENRAAHATVMPWSELQVFPQGAVVKHVRGLFRAIGVNNSAEPGNSTHSRFYLLFYRPLFVINFLCLTVFAALLMQFALLTYSYEWYKLISVSIMMFFNFAALYKLTRNRILLGRCYKDENNSNFLFLSGSTANTATVGCNTTTVHPHYE